MVNQNENQNEFVLVLGPYNENGLRFRSSGESYQNEFVLVFVLVNHNVRSTLVCEKEKKENYSAEATNRKSPPTTKVPIFAPPAPRDAHSQEAPTSETALQGVSERRHFGLPQNVGTFWGFKTLALQDIWMSRSFMVALPRIRPFFRLKHESK